MRFFMPLWVLAGFVFVQAEGFFLEGKVQDPAGFPIENAQVSLSSGALDATTDENGYFLLSSSTTSIPMHLSGRRQIDFSNSKILLPRSAGGDWQVFLAGITGGKKPCG